MRAGGQACLAHVADDLTLPDVPSASDALGEAVEVAIGGGVGAVVADLDEASVSTLPPSEDDPAVADGSHRGPERGGVVHPQMGTIDLQDGMEAPTAVAGGDAGELQG